MKQIVCRSAGSKLRLRGEDSGYLEGDSLQESKEPLHLCISSTEYHGYGIAKEMAVNCIRDMYQEYRLFCRENDLPEPVLPTTLSIIEHPVISKDTTRHIKRTALNQPPTPAEISKMIENRNEARKVSQFQEADKIRNELHKRGVALMDEPGGRGKWTFWSPSSQHLSVIVVVISTVSVRLWNIDLEKEVIVYVNISEEVIVLSVLEVFYNFCFF